MQLPNTTVRVCAHLLLHRKSTPSFIYADAVAVVVGNSLGLINGIFSSVGMGGGFIRGWHFAHENTTMTTCFAVKTPLSLTETTRVFKMLTP